MTIYRMKRLLMLTLGAIAALLVATPGAQAQDDTWRARYWNNRQLSGDPVVRRDEDALDHDWGGDSPHDLVNDDDFSARWTRDVDFAAGSYRFSATMDDGMRVWVDDSLIIDSWRDSQVRTEIADLFLPAGEHTIRVEYYEAGGQAVAKLIWQPIGGPPTPPGSPGWQGAYFNNMTLAGQPTLVRVDSGINFDWKLGSPASAISSDRFSVRWTTTASYDPGRYRFTVRTDDGVRFWVGETLLIDAWHANQAATYSAETTLPGGPVPMRLEYYENEGAALIQLSTARVDEPAIPLPPPAQPGLPQGQKAIVVNARTLNVRATPEMGDNVIGFATGGQEVDLLGRNGGWIKVRLTSGLTGWVGSSYLASDYPFSSLPVLS